MLRYYDDLKVDDIAETLGISAGTVKRYLSDARSLLRDKKVYYNGITRDGERINIRFAHCGPT